MVNVLDVTLYLAHASVVSMMSFTRFGCFCRLVGSSMRENCPMAVRINFDFTFKYMVLLKSLVSGMNAGAERDLRVYTFSIVCRVVTDLSQRMQSEKSSKSRDESGAVVS